ncbi:hypothetical protein LENED_011238 [Lentinula edodes]|uniref:Uncharacterized protein n=1 Tax=Lentinula edodes TaxID=5353 RepID=A0A1Q3EPI0_LENED|nr:hypothetical protein LENED_011238 [Lentinula edodes]
MTSSRLFEDRSGCRCSVLAIISVFCNPTCRIFPTPAEREQIKMNISSRINVQLQEVPSPRLTLAPSPHFFLPYIPRWIVAEADSSRLLPHI